MEQRAPALRRFVSARRFAAAALLGLAASVLPAWAAGGQWTQQGRDAGATAHNPGEKLLGPANLVQLRTLWSGDLDAWNQATEIAAAGGHAYIGRRTADPDATARMQLVSFDLKTGRPDWQVNSPDFFWTPVLTPDLVIVAGNGLDTDGAGRVWVVAFDRATGARRWRTLAPAGTDGFRAPHLKDGLLYMVSGNGYVQALDAASGALRWGRSTGRIQAHSGVAVAASRLFVADYEGTSAYDTADGHLLWRYELAPLFRSQTEAPMVVGKTVLLFDYSGGLRALDASTGALKWLTETPSGDRPTSYFRRMASDGERVFVSNGLSRTQLSAVDLQTGQVAWTLNAGSGTRSPVVANGVVYVPARTIKAFDAATGAALPIARLQPSPGSELIVVDGKLLSSSGPVMAFGLPAAAPH